MLALDERCCAPDMHNTCFRYAAQFPFPTPASEVLFACWQASEARKAAKAESKLAKKLRRKQRAAAAKVATGEAAEEVAHEAHPAYGPLDDRGCNAPTTLDSVAVAGGESSAPVGAEEIGPTMTRSGASSSSGSDAGPPSTAPGAAEQLQHTDSDVLSRLMQDILLGAAGDEAPGAVMADSHGPAAQMLTTSMSAHSSSWQRLRWARSMEADELLVCPLTKVLLDVCRRAHIDRR